jgi:hypothetical protein
MTNINRKQFQAFPYHLVDPSPWPLLTSFALLTMAVGAVMYFHGFANGGNLLTLGFLLTASGMILWFRDVVAEGTNFSKIKIKHFSCLKEIENITNFFKSYVILIIRSSIKRYLFLIFYKVNLYSAKANQTITADKLSLVIPRGNFEFEVGDIANTTLTRGGVDKVIPKPKISRYQLGYYLAGLLEGDGHISIPALGKSTLNRILNPRIVFTFHKKNLKLYELIQLELGGIGRLQSKDENVLRYIIGDIEGINTIIKLLHNKFRTPKIITFNKLIQFMNTKYNLNFEESLLDLSKMHSNSWFIGFTDAR